MAEIIRALRKHGFKLSQPLFVRVISSEAGGTFELRDARVERAVLMVRGAKVAQPRMGLAVDAFDDCLGNAAFLQ